MNKNLISKWWGNYVGGSDDSLLLLDYFKSKSSSDLSLKQILKDLHWQQLETGDLYFKLDDENEPHFDMAIDVVIDLSAILAECLHNGKVSMQDLDNTSDSDIIIKITATREEVSSIKTELDKFITSPESTDLADMMDAKSLSELITDCKSISEALKPFAR